MGGTKWQSLGKTTKLNYKAVNQILLTGWQVQRKSYLRMRNLPESTATFLVSTLKKSIFVKRITLKNMQQCGTCHIPQKFTKPNQQ